MGREIITVWHFLGTGKKIMINSSFETHCFQQKTAMTQTRNLEDGSSSGI